MTYINLASEDELSEAVAEKIVTSKLHGYEISLRLRKGGSGYLKSNLQKFCEIAARTPTFLLTDLDRKPCPIDLLDDWTAGLVIPERLFLRVVVREIESWLLADKIGMADFLGIDARSIPDDPEATMDPKQLLLQLARGARRDIRTSLIASRGSTAQKGLGYNSSLCTFAIEHWSADRASERSESLRRTIARLQLALL